MIKVLCLGAFANGNLGDMYQADAVARLIKEVRSDAEVFSVSPSKRNSTYPTNDHLAGPAGAAFDPAYINTFDVLLVGGGGLLSAPHAPLNDADWVNAITIPICAVSVGAVVDTANISRAFIEQCALFSVRDEFSFESVKDIRPDSEIIMDPILLDAAGSSQTPVGRRSGLTWVPGKLVLGTEELWSNAIHKSFDKKRDSIISFNPITDKNSGFDSVFQNVKYLESVNDFMAIAHSTSCVVSERYHACIYALATGMPAIGVCLRSRAVTSKIEELFRRLGIEQAILRSPFEHDRDQIKSLASTIDMASVKLKLMSERQILMGYISRCLGTI